MAARVVCLTESQWETLQEVFRYDDGGVGSLGLILVTPDGRRAILAHEDEDVTDLHGVGIEYDFGGESDLAIDIVLNERHWATACMIQALHSEESGRATLARQQREEQSDGSE